MKSLERIFHYQNKQVRTVTIHGEAWFVAKDICEILGIRTNTVRSMLEADEIVAFSPNDDTIDIGCCQKTSMGMCQGKTQPLLCEAGRGGKDMLAVSEPGLYALVLKSRRPEARAFRRWITHEVIPALHRSGGYRMDEMQSKAGTLPQFSRRDLLKLAIEAENECQELRGAVAELAPKAKFFDRVADTTSTFSLGEVAKMMDVPGLGRNNLVKFLREEGILMADNVAKQRYVNRGYFQIVQADYYAPDGTLRVKAVTRVKEKGVEFIRHRLDEYLLGYMSEQLSR